MIAIILIFSSFDDVFGSICKDARQIVDTHSVSRVGIADSAHLIWRSSCDRTPLTSIRYCDSVAELVESFGAAAIRPPGGKEIYKENIPIDVDAFLKPVSDIDATLCLVSAVMFTRLLPTLTGRLDLILKGYQISSTSSAFLRDRSTRNELTLSLLLVVPHVLRPRRRYFWRLSSTITPHAFQRN
jgi:hypothetical protein